MKDQLLAGKTLFGTWVRIPHPTMIEILATSGFDFLHIDMEHGAVGTNQLDQLLLAAKANSIPTMVRIPGKEPTWMGRTLDMGAQGIIVPQIQDAHEARAAVQASRFYPLGSRGLGGACRADGFGQIPFQEFVTQSNANTWLLLQIESVKAVNSLDAILDQSAEAADVYYIGPADLSQSLGIPGQFDHPLLLETIQEIVKKVRGRGKTVGIHAFNQEWAWRFAEMGIQYISSSFDIGFLKSGAKQYAAELKKQ